MRTVQPVLDDLEVEVEEAAASLGASRWQTFARVVFPTIAPALLTGFALAFARAIGEYGSVVFISGNMPMKTEIVPLLIITKLEQYDYAGATAVAAGDAARVLRAAADHQPAAVGGAAPRGGLSHDRRCRPPLRHPAPRERSTRATGESRVVRWTLTAIALAFLAVTLVLPLALVFVQALAKGLPAYWQAIREPDALSAARLTLLIASIAVPVNLVFGVAAAWCISKFEFPGQEPADHPDRPAVRRLAGHLGDDLRAALRRARLVRPVARSSTTSRSSSRCPASCWPRPS